MNAATENQYGMIEISDSVIANIAGYAATRCYGVIGMAQKNKTDGLAALLRLEMMSRGVKVTRTESGFALELHIMVEYGVNISAISDNIISNVTYQVEDLVGIKVSDVTVFVDGMRVDE